MFGLWSPKRNALQAPSRTPPACALRWVLSLASGFMPGLGKDWFDHLGPGSFAGEIQEGLLQR